MRAEALHVNRIIADQIPDPLLHRRRIRVLILIRLWRQQAADAYDVDFARRVDRRLADDIHAPAFARYLNPDRRFLNRFRVDAPEVVVGMIRAAAKCNRTAIFNDGPSK